MAKTVQVGIVMGSKSDLPVMVAAAAILSEFEIPFEMDIVSAHRTPEKMIDYAKEAHKRGIRVIIAGAGGAAPRRGAAADARAGGAAPRRGAGGAARRGGPRAGALEQPRR